ncbi:hypothetical protein SS50377_22387 [Spironucleus salmonicida]|uniref:Uncharacterized protein n=1 Tax=Spironucleus salmonicida TaxID=348837 RepID=V6LCZ0_9EUKA|nr:hypothetical protein SS50377_22387 [Spironucleus salmonicida]|eukprot:EST42118.1 Hypothetical protein SS50377_18427 [Spironucleus salmonicida]
MSSINYSTSKSVGKSIVTKSQITNKQFIKAAKQLQQKFSIYEDAHAAALGVLLQLDESKPSDYDTIIYNKVFNSILEILAQETSLSQFTLLEAANKILKYQKSQYQQYSYAALSYINRCGFKSVWESNANCFKGPNFQLLLDEGVRIEICGVQKLVQADIESIVIKDNLGLPREWENRKNDYKTAQFISDLL